MYHIVTNIDSRFTSLEQALSVYNTDSEVVPRIPYSVVVPADIAKPRICVAPTVEQCLTSIGLLKNFRRCLSANKDAVSYATAGLEVYPILVLTFDDALSYYKPFLVDVPDCDVTNEKWLQTATKPTNVEVRWLGMYSILYQKTASIGKRTPIYECTSIKWIDDAESGYNHPWLNGKGHILDSSADENND